MTPGSEQIFVEAPARLHFGILDLRGGLGRWFGGIGAAVSAPSLLVSVRRAETLHVSGEDIERARLFAARFLACHRRTEGARVHVHRALPAHAGLGSGTQLALATGRALAELYHIESDPALLANALGRASRSAIGTWTFADGGFVVEGGRRRGEREAGGERREARESEAGGERREASGDGVAPMLARIPMPPTWQCVIAVPHSGSGMTGPIEEAAFANLPAPPEREVERVAHLVLMALLPSLVEADLAGFGAALSEIQAMTGQWFAPIQGGAFASGASEDLVRRMTALGVPGVGQSSWGPAVYGIVDGEDAGRRLADEIRRALGADGSVYEGSFRNDGARVWRD